MRLLGWDLGESCNTFVFAYNGHGCSKESIDMDVQKNITIKADAPNSIESRIQWAQQGFEKWQHAIGIDGRVYQKHLEKELAACWDDPLLKTLIESI